MSDLVVQALEPAALEPEVLPPEELAIDCKKQFLVVGKPSPLNKTVKLYADVGQSIADLLSGLDPDRLMVTLNGQVIPAEHWCRVKPKAGTTLEVVGFPQGQDAKPILSIVAIAAITVLSAGVAGGALAFLSPALFAAGHIGALAVAAGISIIGNLAIRALISPGAPQPRPASNPAAPSKLNQITGTSNKPNQFGAVPIVLGEMVFFPPFAALPYSAMMGGVQNVYMLLDVGFGNILVDQIRFGTTDVSSVGVIDYQVGTAPSNFSQTTIETQVNADVTTAQVTRLGDVGGDEVSFDLVFPQGLYGVDDMNQTLTATKDFIIGIRKAGDPSFTNLEAYIGNTGGAFPTANSSNAQQVSYNPVLGNPASSVVRISNSVRNPLAIGFRIKVASKGQYELSIQGSTFSAPAGGGRTLQYPTGVGSPCNWTVLRTVKYSSPSTVAGPYGDLPTRIGMHMQASEEIQGQLQQVNCRVRQQIKTWNSGTGTWNAPAPSKNPAWIYYWLLTACPSNSRQVAESRLNLTDIINWGADCDAKGYVFSAIYDSTTTLEQVIRDVCAAGRATFAVKDGKYSVVRDVAQTVPVQHFTPRNSWKFRGSRVFTEQIHALRVHFLNPGANYQQDEEIVYDDGYNADGSGGLTAATNFETIDFRGVTDAAAAWRLARYHLAVARLRQNDYSFYCDVEQLACQRGDLIKVSHDVMNWGKDWGRVNYSALCGPNLLSPNAFGAPWTFENGLVMGATNLQAPDATFTATAVTGSGDLYVTLTSSSDGSGLSVTIWVQGAANQNVDLLLQDSTTVAGVPGTTGSGTFFSQGRYRNAVKAGVWTKISITCPSVPVGHQVLLVVYTAAAQLWGVTAWKGAADRVQQVQLDEVVDLPAGQQWSIRVRKQDGSSAVSGIAGYSTGQYVWDLVTPIVGVNYGDLVQVGSPGLESNDLIITKIEPGTELSARISCQDYAAAVYTADSAAPPVFISPITGKAYEEPPPVPTIVVTNSDPLRAEPDDDGGSSPILGGQIYLPGHVRYLP